MKIWLLAENWPPRRGGIENYLFHIAQILGERGHAVTVMAPRIIQENRKQKIEKGEDSIAVIRKRFFWPFIRPKWLPLFLWLWRRAKHDRPDIILGGKALFEGLLAYYLRRQLHIPYVIFTYAMEIYTWKNAHGTKRKLQRVLQTAARVVCINDLMAHNLRELGVEEKQLVKITPGVDERYLRAVTPTLAKATATHYAVRQPYILSVGRLVLRKGFDTLIEAFSKLDQTKYATHKLVIVGDGPDRERLEKLVADNYMQTSVVFLPDVPTKHLPMLYAGAELFALLPREVEGDVEGFGIVYLEAAAAGRACLGTLSGGVAEAVVDNKTGLLISPNNPQAAAQALNRLLADEQLRHILGEAGKQRVIDGFRWKGRGEALEGLLRS